MKAEPAQGISSQGTSSQGISSQGTSSQGTSPRGASPHGTSTHIQDHVDLVAKHEQDFLERRSVSERVGDAVGALIGSLTFVLLHGCWFAAWMLVNVLHTGLVPHFDPFPFPLLDLCVALEAIFLASFIVMRQQRMGRRADERDHLILQVLLLTEKEVTASLGLERAMASRLGLGIVADAEEVTQLSEHTSIEAMTETLKEHVTESY